MPANLNPVMHMRSYILHPQAESFGPYDLAFVHEKLAEGGIAPTTGITVPVEGRAERFTDVGTVPREEDGGK
jgi:hypothetical protein